MFTKRLFAVILVGVLILSACDQARQGGNTADAVNTLVAQSGVDNAASQAQPSLVVLPATNTSPPVEVKPTATKSPATITITSITETGPGRAIVNWDAVGQFPSGFKLVWTTVERKPTFPEDSNSYTSDPNARSAMFSGLVGKIYFLRVCRFLGDTCDVYSDLGIFIFTNKAPTEAYNVLTKTVFPTLITGGGTTGGGTVPTTVAFQITTMSGGEDGKAFIAWTSDTSPAKGFKILYSKTHTSPTLGEDPYFYLSSGTTRSAYVDGTPGTKYYYRICKYTGTACEAYTPSYSYTFPGIAYTSTPDPAVIVITSITDLSTGKATVNWTATGTFPKGFKVVYSKTNTSPTLNDKYVYVSDGALRTAMVTGDPSAKYYFRVCKYFDGMCVAYSTTVSFTFADAPPPTPDGSTITGLTAQDVSAGKALLSWTATGVFPDGFKILSSTTDPDPVYGSADMFLVSGSTRSTYVTGIPRTTYYYRVCKYTGSGCSIYSDSISYTYPEIPTDPDFVLSVGSISAGTVVLNWTLPVNNSGGYKVLWSFANPPIYPENMQAYVLLGRTHTYTATGLGSATTYYFRLCKYNGTICTAYSNTVSATTP